TAAKAWIVHLVTGTRRHCAVVRISAVLDCLEEGRPYPVGKRLVRPHGVDKVAVERGGCPAEAAGWVRGLQGFRSAGGNAHMFRNARTRNEKGFSCHFERN